MTKKYQIGGKVATTKKEQRKGLNDQLYDQMHFPVLDNPIRQFRGLDTCEGVAVIDQLGRQQVLHGPDDMATTYGHVQEQRLNSWAPSWGQQMQTGGKAPTDNPTWGTERVSDVTKQGFKPTSNKSYGNLLQYSKLLPNGSTSYKYVLPDLHKDNIQSVSIRDLKQFPVDRQEPQPEQININDLNPNEEQWLSPQTTPFRPAGFYKQNIIPGQPPVPTRQYGGSQNNTDMAKKQGYTVPGYKYGGSKLNDMAIIPDTNPYGTGTQYVPVQYQRAQNGMMKNGGYLDFISYPEMPNSNMQYGGGTTNYAPVNQDNASIDFVNDKRGYNQMQTPGKHWTNDGWKKSTGSTMNGASWSKFGGPGPANGLPAPLEYAYLQDGGYISQYHTGGQMQQGGFAENGPMIYNQTEEMKTGGIHIKPENKGKFTAYKQRTGKTTEEALHSPDPHVRQMANFARNAKKWHKKEFGGPIEKNSPLAKFIKHYQQGGEVDLDTPAVNSDPNAYKSSQDTNADVTGYQASTAPDAGQMPQQGGYEAAQGPVTSEGDITNPDQQQPSLKYTPQQNRQAIAQAGNNMLGAGLAAASFFEDKRNQRNMAADQRLRGQSDQAFAAQKLNTAGNKGDYNQAGNFRPNQNTPVAPGMIYPQMQMGGYKSGGEYELDDREIARLQKAGYKVQYL